MSCHGGHPCEFCVGTGDSRLVQELVSRFSLLSKIEDEPKTIVKCGQTLRGELCEAFQKIESKHFLYIVNVRHGGLGQIGCPLMQPDVPWQTF